MKVLSVEMERYVSQPGFREALREKLADPERRHDGFLPSQEDIDRACRRVAHEKDLRHFDHTLREAGNV